MALVLQTHAKNTLLNLIRRVSSFKNGVPDYAQLELKTIKKKLKI